MPRLADTKWLADALREWAKTRENPQFVEDIAGLLPGPESAALDLVGGPMISTQEAVEHLLKMMDTLPKRLRGFPEEQVKSFKRTGQVNIETMMNHILEGYPDDALSRLKSIDWTSPMDAFLNLEPAGSFRHLLGVPGGATPGHQAVEELLSRGTKGEILPPMGYGRISPGPWDIRLSTTKASPMTGIHELGHARHALSETPFEEYSMVKSLMEDTYGGRFQREDKLSGLVGALQEAHAPLGYSREAVRNAYNTPLETLAASYGVRRTPHKLGYVAPGASGAQSIGDILQQVGQQFQDNALLQWLIKGGS